jgi:hypothetical protein
MNRVKLILLLIGILNILGCHNADGQNQDKVYSFSIGLNLASPKFIYFNQESFKKTIPNLQFAINRDFFLDTPLSLTVSLGLNINSFNVGRQIGTIYSIKQIDLWYLGLEGGPDYKTKFKQIGVGGSLNFRVSRIVKENYSSYYTVPSLNSSDLGLNLVLRIKLLSHAFRPYLQFNHYYGLNKVAKNQIITGTGQSFDDYMRNISFGVQIGFYFK